MALKIGSYSFPVPLFMAPMAGITDLPMRNQVRRWGAAMATSEMITAQVELWSSNKSQTRLPDLRDPLPRPIQIAGADPVDLAEAARQAVALGAGIIDINMGCPAKKVCKKAAGSALLADEGLVRDILASVTASVTVPVTLKIRTGTDPQHRNAQRVARIAEEQGVAALYIHGRTRACRFQGKAEYDTISRVAAETRLPVIANGDIDSPDKALQVMERTGAAGLMIGRGVLGQPWLFRDIARAFKWTSAGSSEASDKWLSIFTHLREIHQFYGLDQGVRMARKHMGWYLDTLGLPPAWKARFNLLETPEQQEELMHQAMLHHAPASEHAA